MNRRGWLTTATVIAGVGALAVVLAQRVDEALAARRDAAAEQPLEKPRVRTEPLAKHEIVDTMRFTGTLRAANRVDVVPEVSGRLETVEVRVGDRVTAKQILAVIEHRSLELQRSQAHAESSGANAAVRRAKLDLEAAKRDRDRTEQLAGHAAASQSERDEASDRVRLAEAALQTAVSQRESRRAAAEISGESLGDSRIFTPIAGIVTRRSAHPGTQVTPAQPIFEVQDIDTILLDGAVTAKQFVHLQVGQPVEVAVDAYPGKIFAGEISTLSPSLDRQTRRAAIEVRLDNPEHELLPNMFAHARIVVERKSGVLAVPSSAVVSTPDGPVIFVVKAGVVAHIAMPDAGGESLVRTPEGLAEGDAIVVEGQQGLADGDAVVVASQAAAAP